MQGAEERRLRRMNYTPQGGAIEGNAADDILMVDQGVSIYFDNLHRFYYLQSAEGPDYTSLIRYFLEQIEFWKRRGVLNEEDCF